MDRNMIDTIFIALILVVAMITINTSLSKINKKLSSKEVCLIQTLDFDKPMAKLIIEEK